MSSFSRTLAPCFAAAAIGLSGCGGAVVQKIPTAVPLPSLMPKKIVKQEKEEEKVPPPPFVYTSAESFIAANDQPSDIQIPEKVENWRDVFVVRGQTPETKKEGEKTLDRLFSNPEVSKAMIENITENRRIADYVESQGGSGLFFESILDAARNKTLILVATEGVDTSVRNAAVIPVSVKNRQTMILTSATIVLQTQSQMQYMGTDGRYHDDTLLASAAHELAHVIFKDKREQETVERTNAWVSAVDPSYVPRANYFQSRLKPETADCQKASVEIFNDTVQTFDDALRDKNPADPAPKLNDEKGHPLKGKALARRLVEDYYSLCPGFKAP